MPDRSKSLRCFGIACLRWPHEPGHCSDGAVARVNAAIEARVSVCVSRGESKVAAPGPVNEGNELVVAETLDMPICPDLHGHGPLGVFGVRVNLIRRAIEDKHVTAIGLPARGAGRCPKMLVGVRKPVVVLLLKLVFGRAGSRIATLPELFNEMVPLLICRELLKGGALGIVNNIDDILVQPFGIGRY